MAAVLPSPITQTGYTPHSMNKMKAARWMETREVEVGLVPKPTITDPSDAIVQITHCTICGSDLHMYEGDLNDAMKRGDILGQEGIGIVEEVGSNVKTVKAGDRVIIFPVIACGKCEYCQRQEFSLCDVSNPSDQMESMYGHRLAGHLGYSRLFGGYPGDQAEYCRVPNADLTCAKAPKDVDARKLLGLSKVITSAWHALELAEVQAGDVVGVWGCGPVGLSVQRLAKLRGARKIYAMDKDPQRLRLAEDIGMTPVDVTEHPDVGTYLLSIQPNGLDRAIEASGFRSTLREPHAAMRAIGLERDSSDTVADGRSKQRIYRGPGSVISGSHIHHLYAWAASKSIMMNNPIQCHMIKYLPDIPAQFLHVLQLVIANLTMLTLHGMKMTSYKYPANQPTSDLFI